MFKFAFIVAILCAAALSAADMRLLSDSEKTEISAKLSEVARNTKSIHSSFVQVKNISVLSEKIRSSGVFYFKKDNMIRWEYQKPYKYIIIYNGSKVFINDDGKTTQFDAKANRIFQEINGTILSSMKGVITENPNFSVSFFKLQNKYLVKLSPKSNDLLKYVTRIEIYFDDKYLAVTEMNIYEKSGDYTNIVFKNREFNKNIPDSIFNPGM